ncbi:hypothetical protein [Staphylococcus equorum]|uniref:Uncharacterized protein n=1 Tax=Staphylococcus equorum TaxID=246432 RepID=A0A9X4R578_9STAP|nr:hypothetical protein [Staphylococcus equorum]MDG0860308.1 hypothetical protein [Staphylococcus equorum]
MNYQEIFNTLEKSDFEEVMKAFVKWSYAVEDEEVLEKVAEFTLDNLQIDYLLNEIITDKIWKLDGIKN